MPIIMKCFMIVFFFLSFKETCFEGKFEIFWLKFMRILYMTTEVAWKIFCLF